MNDRFDHPHQGVAKALERLAERMVIADDGPYVAFVIGVNVEGHPTMWAADMNGCPTDLRRMSWGKKTETATQPVPWTFSDLEDADRWLGFYRMGCRVRSGPKVLQYAEDTWERVKNMEMERELERDRYLLDRPFQCEHCKGRYKSQGALTSHVRHHCRVAAEARFRQQQGNPDQSAGDQRL